MKSMNLQESVLSWKQITQSCAYFWDAPAVSMLIENGKLIKDPEIGVI